MLKRIVQATVNKLGYRIIRIQPNEVEKPLFTLYDYTDKDGSFDYNSYRRIQTDGNKQKTEWVWVIEENIAFLASYIRGLVKNPQFGICHGTRRGKEQEWFRKYLGCEVIGTEISDTAGQFPNTIQWDFHQAKPDWIDAVDFIYSNSFDHSYDPQACLTTWMSCVKKGGLCILEHSSWHTPQAASKLDPFGAELVIMPYLIATWGDGKYGVRQLIQAPKKSDNLTYNYFIVVQRF